MTSALVFLLNCLASPGEHMLRFKEAYPGSEKIYKEAGVGYCG